MGDIIGDNTSQIDRNFLIELSHKLNERYGDDYRRSYYIFIVGIIKILQQDSKDVGLAITLPQAYTLFIRHPNLAHRFQAFFLAENLFPLLQ